MLYSFILKKETKKSLLIFVYTLFVIVYKVLDTIIHVYYESKNVARYSVSLFHNIKLLLFVYTCIYNYKYVKLSKTKKK